MCQCYRRICIIWEELGVFYKLAFCRNSVAIKVFQFCPLFAYLGPSLNLTMLFLTYTSQIPGSALLQAVITNQEPTALKPFATHTVLEGGRHFVISLPSVL